MICSRTTRDVSRNIHPFRARSSNRRFAAVRARALLHDICPLYHFATSSRASRSSSRRHVRATRRARTRFLSRVSRFRYLEDARAFLRVALDERSRAHSTATTTTRAREDARARDVPGSILALMREACGRRDRARAALACAALLREMMGVVGARRRRENARGARRRRHKGGPTSERRSWGDREVLYCAMELLSEESKTVGGTRGDADGRGRVWDKIAATSAAGSARAERDAAERAMRMVLEEDDVESALMVLGEKRRKSPKNPVEGVRGTAGRFAGEGDDEEDEGARETFTLGSTSANVEV